MGTSVTAVISITENKCHINKLTMLTLKMLFY